MNRIFTKPTLLQRLGKTTQELSHEASQRKVRNCFIALAVLFAAAEAGICLLAWAGV